MNNSYSRAVVFSCIFVLLVFVAAGCSGRQDDDVSYDLQSLEPVSEVPAESDDSPQDNIYVYVCGQVVQPGVYEVPCEARIFEVLKLAGGVREEADLSAINQAQKLSDGQQIYIPSMGGDDETGQEGRKAEKPVDDGLVNINTADVSELVALPGIGETRARAIIDYREQQGPYQTVEDIMNVTGIKEGLYGKIADKIKVN
ncbi:MAG: helix-hairpin-helix domain-containing protein [Lachnospiraceae bacterium]|nr:helix-hairpin-helix domain-containing protein [Lachnospiraceae bacterium]